MFVGEDLKLVVFIIFLDKKKLEKYLKYNYHRHHTMNHQKLYHQ